MPIEAVIFDMDGVLVDSEVYWERARSEFARDLGKVWSTEDQHLAMGRNTVEWATIMHDLLALGDSMTVPQVIEGMIGRMTAFYDAHLPVRPGAVQAVQLAGQHYRVALASASPTALIKHVTEITGLDQVFEVMVFGDDFERGEPAPDIYLAALRQLGVEASHAVGVEDSSNGIRSLKAAGMYAIAAPSPEFPLSAEILAMADRKIDSLEDFSLELVEGLN